MSSEEVDKTIIFLSEKVNNIINEALSTLVLSAFVLKNMAKSKNNLRPDRVGAHRTAFEKNRKRIITTQEYCYLCGKIVDKSLKRPDPMAAEVDHIIPVAKGGHPSDISNLCLVHGKCNRQKGDKMLQNNAPAEHKVDPLAWSFDWVNSFKA